MCVNYVSAISLRRGAYGNKRVEIRDQRQISIDTNKRGELAITTDIFDSRDDIVVSFEKDKYNISNEAFAVERPDASTLTVVIKHLKEKILDVRFLNKHAIRILGHFHYPGSPDVVATESGLRLGSIGFAGPGCAVESGIADVSF